MKKITLAIIFPLTIISCGEVVSGNDTSTQEPMEKLAVGDVKTETGTESIQKKDDSFKSEDGNFTIKFMGTPKESSEMVPTEVGDIEMTTFMYEKSVTEAYMVAYNDYPSEMVKKSSVDALLDGAKNGSSSSMKITHFDIDENIEIEGCPGRHFKGYGGSIYVEYKLFLKENRLYQIALLRDGSYATKERSDEFFGSFHLLKK